MSLAPENTCPECDGWKGGDYDLCRSCAEGADQEPVRVTYHARIGETELAVLFKLAAGFTARKVWVPKSQLLDEGVGGLTFSVPRWFAAQEGLD